MKSRIYAAERVENKDRRFGAAKHYYVALLEHPNSPLPTALAFTEDDIKAAARRAEHNFEDFPPPVAAPSWLQRLRAFFRN